MYILKINKIIIFYKLRENIFENIIMTENIIEDIKHINQKCDIACVYNDQCALVLQALSEIKEKIRSLPDNQFKKPEIDDVHKLLCELHKVIDGFSPLNWSKTCLSEPITKPFADLQTIMDSITEHLKKLNITLNKNYEVLQDEVANDLKSLYGIFADPKRLEEQDVKKKLREISKYLIRIDRPLDQDSQTKKSKHHHHKKAKKHKSEESTDPNTNLTIPDYQEEEEDEFNNFDNIQQYKLKKTDYIQDEWPIVSTKIYKIYTGQLISTKEAITITVLDSAKNSEDKFKRLKDVLTAVHHPYLETFIGAVEKPLPSVIITRRKGEKLSEILRRAKQKSKQKVTDENDDENLIELKPGYRTIIAFNVASAMAYLHSIHIIHRDLSASSILVDKSFIPRITNFANSRFLPEENTFLTAKPVSSSYFVAPELTVDEDYDETVDVFSFGGILYEMLVGKAPFSGYSREEVENKLSKGERPPFPPEISDDLRNLIESCWSQDPRKRPSFSAVIDKMLEDKIAFIGDEGTSIVNEFYSSKKIKNNDLQDCIILLKKLCEIIQKSDFYLCECIRIRSLLFGYHFLLETSSIATQENSNEKVKAQLKYLRESLENLFAVVKLTNSKKWANIALFSPATEISTKMYFLMEKVYIAMTELGFNVTKYEYAKSDLVKDYHLVYNAIIEYVELHENAQKRINEIIQFSKEKEFEISTEKVIEDKVTKLLLNYKDYKVDKNEFIKGKFIGSGMSANVFQGKQKSSGIDVAIKIFNKDYLENESTHSYLRREICFLSQLHHTYLVDFIGFNNDPGEQLWIITKFYEKGSLLHANLNRRLNPFQKTKIAFQIAEGMNYLHSKRVIHRDLKTDNIMLDNDFNPKISDFGYARNNLSLLMTEKVGTFNYMAPEVILGKNYGLKADVFSFGMILFELHYENFPFSWRMKKSIIDAIIDDDPLPFKKNISEDLKKLIIDCKIFNHKKRPSFEQILERMINERIAFNGADEKEINEFYRLKSENRERIDLKTTSSGSGLFASALLNF